MEAYCFARWIGGERGNLPTVSQWDAAGGRGRGAQAPYQDPESSNLPARDEVAIGRKSTGPMRVGIAPRDKSVFGCRDMAGNGQEWTRSTTDPTAPFPPQQRNLLYVVRGQAYYLPSPFRFSSQEPDYKSFGAADPALGFRVVIEP
jgi:formylglycine-generating enzyme required for sulfatase activity